MNERPILFSAPMVRAILEGRKTMTRRVVKDSAWVEDAGDQDPATGHTPSLMSIDVSRCPYGKPGDRLWGREHWGYRGSRSGGIPDSHAALVYYHADQSKREIEFDSFREMQAVTPGQNIKKPPGFEDLDEWDQRFVWNDLLDKWWDRKRSIPSIHMPRWASRVLLEVTEVRVERLNDISEVDAKAEGAPFVCEMCGNDLDTPEGEEIHFGCDDSDCEHVSHLEGFRRLWQSINGPESWDLNPWVWVVSFKKIGEQP
jgi:hypothetical protein